jgi:hypothetical protein
MKWQGGTASAPSRPPGQRGGASSSARGVRTRRRGDALPPRTYNPSSGHGRNSVGADAQVRVTGSRVSSTKERASSMARPTALPSASKRSLFPTTLSQKWWVKEEPLRTSSDHSRSGIGVFAGEEGSAGRSESAAWARGPARKSYPFSGGEIVQGGPTGLPSGDQEGGWFPAAFRFPAHTRQLRKGIHG